MADPWDPGRYEQFEAERRQPFDDLLALVQAVGGGRVVDLGCGTGALTAELHARTGATETIGVDSSAAMLARAEPRSGRGLRFEQADLASAGWANLDLAFANASLQWAPDHPALLARLRGMLRPGGQLAFQVPANRDHPSHRLAAEVGAEPPFAAALGATVPDDHLRAVLPPERYAEILDALGANPQHVRLQVYGHHLVGPEAVVAWVQGTLLTPYRARLDPDVYDAFIARYQERLLAELPSTRPYFYAFKRILAWARFDDR